MDADRELLGNLILARGEVDRAAEWRADAHWLAAHRADPTSRVLLVCDGGARVLRHADGSVALDLSPASEVAADIDLTLLGVDADGVAYFSRHGSERAPDDETWADLRQVGAELDGRDAGLMVTAVALDNWLRTHHRCPGAARRPSSTLPAGRGAARPTRATTSHAPTLR